MRYCWRGYIELHHEGMTRSMNQTMFAAFEWQIAEAKIIDFPKESAVIKYRLSSTFQGADHFGLKLKLKLLVNIENMR